MTLYWCCSIHTITASSREQLECCLVHDHFLFLFIFWSHHSRVHLTPGDYTVRFCCRNFVDVGQIHSDHPSSQLVHLEITKCSWRSLRRWTIINYCSFRWSFVITRWSLVPLHVESQMIWSWKTPFTMAAFERFHPGMFSMMSRKLIWSSEPPLAAFPWTPVGFFACKKWTKYEHFRIVGHTNIAAYLTE